MARRFLPWLSRVALGIVGVMVVAWLGTGWMHANALRAEFLTAKPALEGYPLVVHSNEAGRVVLDRTPETTKEGLWALESSDAFAQVATIVRIDDSTVERGVTPVAGELAIGDNARFNNDFFTGDPASTYGLVFDTPRSPSDIGPHPTWFIDGRRATWVVFVHGRGNDRLAESLRIIPSLVEQGFPVLSITYRNDVEATPSVTGMRLWGLDEWQDIEAALDLAQRKGAKDVVIVGSGFGASIVSTFLHESGSISMVRAVIYDSPVLDLEGVVRRWASQEGTPRPVAWLGRRIAAVRFGVDWNLLNQLERTDQFDVRMLLMFGVEDPYTPTEEFTSFAAGVAELVDVERFEQGGHTNLWNIDADRYESSIAEFLLDVVGPE